MPIDAAQLFIIMRRIRRDASGNQDWINGLILMPTPVDLCELALHQPPPHAYLAQPHLHGLAPVARGINDTNWNQDWVEGLKN
jgi:hypothetical protein